MNIGMDELQSEIEKVVEEYSDFLRHDLTDTDKEFLIHFINTIPYMSDENLQTLKTIVDMGG